jgi:hypothetical protein
MSYREEEFKTGSRVQWINEEGIFDGTIETIIPAPRMKVNDYWKYTQAEQDEMITYADVKWDDGTRDSVDIEDLDQEDTLLERQFRLMAASVTEQIETELAVASAALDRAVALSEKHGVPFYASVSPLGQAYRPGGTDPAFEDIDSEFIRSVISVNAEYEGWQHSDVC